MPPWVYRAYRRLPARLRVLLVRTWTPSYWVGASCAVQRDDGAVLLVRQSYRRGWALPGGLLKRGESPADAAVRETREEVGVEVEVDGHPRVVVDTNRRRVDVVYPARLLSGGTADPTPLSNEILEARWCSLDGLPPLQPETVLAFAELGLQEPPSSSTEASRADSAQ